MHEHAMSYLDLSYYTDMKGYQWKCEGNVCRVSKVG